MTKISWSPVGLVAVTRPLMNAILRPSERQVGNPSNPAVAVRLTLSPPVRVIVQISMTPVRSLTNAILPFAPGNVASAGPTPAARLPTQTAATTATTRVARAAAGAAGRVKRVNAGIAASGTAGNGRSGRWLKPVNVRFMAQLIRRVHGE